jgi:bis(5'-nucleosyl)-tetraphosphatase (symmetrical)
MATYALGDIHGCFRTLERLLRRIAFDPPRDRLWNTGDLVNRGPHSLEVLRWARALGDRLTVVLGNHDLHLLARAAGLARAKPRDTLEEVLAAPDRDELLAWLRARPLLHAENGRVLVHAGLLSAWTVAEAQALARSLEARLRAPGGLKLLSPASQAPQRTPLWVLTRMRVCAADGSPGPDFTGPPEAAPPDCRPWFAFPGRRSAEATILFGHWAALGFYQAPGLLGLDSGCVWGGALTAVRLEDAEVFEEPAAE